MMCSHTLTPEELSEGKLLLGILCVGVVQHRNFSSDATAAAELKTSAFELTSH